MSPWYSFIWSRWLKPILLIGLLLPGCGVLEAQEFNFKNYTTKDGLPSPYILRTYQDKLGYLWVSTANGLSRFDGKTFTNYGLPEGLPHPFADAICMDSRQRLWVGTRRGIVEMKGDRFISYPQSDSLQPKFIFNFVEIVQGKIWALTDMGVYQFEDNRWNKVRLYPGYENHPCRGITQTARGLYINYGRLLVFRSNDGKFQVIGPYHDNAYFYNVIQESKGKVLISTVRGLLGIRNNQLVPELDSTAGLKDIYVFFYDSKGRTWICDELHGLRIVYSGSRQFEFPLRGRQPELVSSVMEDDVGNIWISGNHGLIKLSENLYKTYKTSQPGLESSSKIIRNIFQCSGGPLFINDGTTTLKSFVNEKFLEYPLQYKSRDSLPNHELIIDNYALDDKGRAWFSIRGFSLAMMKGRRLYEMAPRLSKLLDEEFDICFDPFRKKILVVGKNSPFPVYFNDTGFVPLPVNCMLQPQGHTMHVHGCPNGMILMATDRGEVYSVDRDNRCKLQLKEFGSKGIIRNFYDDRSGDVWIIYGGRALRRYSWKGDSLVYKEELTKNKVLNSNNVEELCFDKMGLLWVVTSSSIFVIREVSPQGQHRYYKIIAYFSKNDLLDGDSFSEKITLDSQGDIWIAFEKQLIRFFPQKILNNKALPPVTKIEDIKLNLQATDWRSYADSLDGIFQVPVGLQLPHDKNTLGIYFKAVQVSGTEGVQYSYQLEGFKNSWSTPGPDDFISFVNLPHGNYNFRVKSKLPGSDWGKEAVFTFRISPAFWETWWFRTLVVLTGSFLIILAFRYRINQISTAVELKNKLHELELKALKSQMNPHFIFNALNSIQALILDKRSREAGDYISKFARLLRQVLENSDTNIIPLEKELYSIRLYIIIEKLRLNFDVQFDLDIDPAIIPEREMLPSLILQPFVENSLWHGLSKKQGEKKLSIRIRVEQDWFLIEISDNGIGRARASENYGLFPEGHLSKALSICRQRLLSFNQPNKTDPIRYIDHFDDKGEPSGTTVVLKIMRFPLVN